MYWLLLLISAGILCWISLKKWTAKNNSYWLKRNTPFFDNTKLFTFWERITFKYGIHEAEQITYNAVKNAGVTTYTGIMEFINPTFYIVDLDLIKTVLVKDFDSFVDRRSFTNEKTDPLFSKMLISLKGQNWKDLRATMSPTFTTGKIRRLFSVFNDSSNKLADFLHRETEHQNEIELRDAIGRYTLDVIASAAFGIDSQSFSSSDSEFSKFAKRFQNQFGGIRAMKFLVALIAPKILSFLKIPLTDQGATNFFAQVIKDSIKHREASGEKRQDFLQLMVEARNSKEETVSDELNTFEKDAQIQGSHTKVQLTEDLILAQSLLFFLGGFDTVETMLLLAAYELALNQDAQQTLYEELKNASEGNNGELTYDLVMKLEYLEQVASETLRKWPPGIRIERKCTKTYKIPNTDIVLDSDTMISIPVYGIHRDEKYYPEPERFLPERFTAENKAKRNPYTYMPFGAGPRNCIAMRFALAEGKAAIAHLILNFKLEPSAKTEIPLKFKPMTALKPANGIWLRVSPRN